MATDELEDLVKDRLMHHVLESRSIKIMYDKWVVGNVSWYNQKLERYRIVFNDGTEDYISLNDIDGTNIILL